MNGNTEIADRETGEKELRRLMNWAIDNPREWFRLCHPEVYAPEIEPFINLIENLADKHLYTTMYSAFFSHQSVKGIEWAVDKTINESLLDTPSETLIQRILHNLKTEAKAYDAELDSLGIRGLNQP